jgi:hypothetical protein
MKESRSYETSERAYCRRRTRDGTVRTIVTTRGQSVLETEAIRE